MQLRRNGFDALVSLPIFLGAAIGGSFAFGSKTAAGIVLGLVSVAVLVTAFVVRIRDQRRFAAALSEWSGAQVRAGELPSVNSAARFDAWCRKRSLVAPPEPSGPGPNPFA